MPEVSTINPPARKLYDNLHKDGLYTKSFEEFEQKYSDDAEMTKLHSGLVADKLYTKDLASFKNQYFAKQDTSAIKGVLSSFAEDIKAPATQGSVTERQVTPFLNAIKRGSNLADQANLVGPETSPTPESLGTVAALQSQQLPSSPAYQKFNESKSFGEALDSFTQDPVGILGELTAESLTSLAKYGGTKILNRALQGGVMGATAGTAIPGIGTAAGLTGGLSSGAVTGMAEASYGLEYTSKILEVLKEAGIDITNKEDLISAFSNEDTMSRARELANKKAIPIALFDLVSGGLAGRIVTKPAKSLLAKLGKGAAEVGTQAILGGAGETAGQLTSGEKIQPGAILAESLGEIATTPISIAAGAKLHAEEQINQSVESATKELSPVLKQAVDSEAAKVAEEIKPEVIPEPSWSQKPQEEKIADSKKINDFVAFAQNKYPSLSWRIGPEKMPETMVYGYTINEDTGERKGVAISVSDILSGQANIHIQEQLKNTNAVQIESPTSVDVREQATPSEGIPSTHPQEQTPPQKEKVVVYGTLRNPETRARALGEEVPTTPANIKGMLRTKNDFSTLYPGDGNTEGEVMELTPDQAEKLDEYEEKYSRKEVALEDGSKATAYFLDDEKPSRKNPWADAIRSIAKDKDETSLLSKARLLINEFPERARDLTAKLINATGKGRTVESFKALIDGLREAANIPKKVTTNTKTQFHERIRNFARGVRVGRIDEKSDRVNMIATLKDIIGKTKLPSKVMNSILGKLGKIEFRNTDKIIALADYVERVTNDADFAAKMEAVETFKDRIGDSYKRKLPPAQHQAVKTLLSVDPSKLENPDEYIATVSRLADNLKPVTNESWSSAVSLRLLEDVSTRTVKEIELQRIRRTQEILIEEMDSMTDTSQDVDTTISQEEKDEETKEKLHDIIDQMKEEEIPSKAGFEAEHDSIVNAKRNELNRLSIEDLKNYVRKLDQIIVNGDYSGTGNILTKLELIRDENSIPPLQRPVGPMTSALSTFATGLNFVYNQAKDLAAKFRAHTGIQDELDGSTKANTHYHKQVVLPIQDLKNTIEFGSTWKKLLSKVFDIRPGYKNKIELTSADNNELSKTYTEFIQRLEHLTPEQAFQNAKINIETSIENLKAIGKIDESLRKDKAYSYFKGARDAKEARDTMAKLHPEVKKWVEGLQDIWKKANIEEKSYKTLEIVDEEHPAKVEGYLPLGTKTTDGISLEPSFRQRREALLTDQPAVGSLQTRQDVIGSNAYRTGEFLNDITTRAKEALLYSYTALPRQKLVNFQKKDAQSRYKWTGDQDKADKLFSFIKEKIDEPKGHNYGPMASAANSAFNVISRVVYSRTLGGPLQMIKQYVGIIPAYSDFVLKGNGDLLYGNGANTPSAKKVRDLHTIGGRFDYYAGLTTAIETEGTIKSHTQGGRSLIDRGVEYIARNLANLDELATAISNVTVRSMFGKADSNLANRVWSGAYQSYLKRNGVDPQGTEEFWANEYKLRNTPLRKEAGAYAESYVGENLQHSTGLETFSWGKKVPGIVRMMFPLVGYGANKTDSVLKNIQVASQSPFGSTQQSQALGNASRNILEAVSYAMVVAFVTTPIKEYLTETWRHMATKLNDPDEDDEERRKALRVRRVMQDAIRNSISPPALVITADLTDEAIGDYLNHMLYEYSNEGEDYTNWLEAHGGEPIPVFKNKEVSDIGIFGMFKKLTGNDQNWWVDGADLKWQDERGNLHTQELTDEQLSAFYNPMIKFVIGFAGSEALGAVESAERQAVKEAKSR